MGASLKKGLDVKPSDIFLGNHLTSLHRKKKDSSGSETTITGDVKTNFKLSH